MVEIFNLTVEISNNLVEAFNCSVENIGKAVEVSNRPDQSPNYCGT